MHKFHPDAWYTEIENELTTLLYPDVFYDYEDVKNHALNKYNKTTEVHTKNLINVVYVAISNKARLDTTYNNKKGSFDYVESTDYDNVYIICKSILEEFDYFKIIYSGGPITYSTKSDSINLLQEGDYLIININIFQYQKPSTDYYELYLAYYEPSKRRYNNMSHSVYDGSYEGVPYLKNTNSSHKISYGFPNGQRLTKQPRRKYKYRNKIYNQSSDYRKLLYHAYTPTKIFEGKHTHIYPIHIDKNHNIIKIHKSLLPIPKYIQDCYNYKVNKYHNQDKLYLNICLSCEHVNYDTHEYTYIHNSQRDIFKDINNKEIKPLLKFYIN